MAGFDDVLLHKTKQQAMLRTTLNTNFTDMKELEFEIRKQAPADTDHSAQALLKDHYARNMLLTSGKPTYANLAIPLVHRRDMSKNSPQDKYLRPHYPHSTSRFSQYDPSEGSQTARMSTKAPLSDRFDTYSTPKSRVSLQSERSDGIVGLAEHILFTRSRVLQHKKAIFGSQVRLVRGLQECIDTINDTFKVDVHGYVPKALVEYKKKRAILRAQQGLQPGKPQKQHFKKDVVREYRSALLRKALAHGLDRDTRYVYTLGTIDATNT